MTAAVCLNTLSVRRVEAFRGIFTMRNKAMDTSTSPLVAALTVSGMRVMLVGAFVSVLTVSFVLVVLHRRVTSA